MLSLLKDFEQFGNELHDLKMKLLSFKIERIGERCESRQA